MLHSEKDLDKPYQEVYGLVHSMACFLTFKAFGLFDTAERNEPDLHLIFLSKLPASDFYTI